jgi:hypothetical protein
VDADAVDVTISGPREADLQVTTIVMPRDLPAVDLKIQPSYDADGDLNLKLSVIGRGLKPIHLTSLAWEPLVPPADPKLPILPYGRLDQSGIVAQFGSAALDSGNEIRSSPLKLASVRRESGPYVLKLIGFDATGRTVTAWADINQGSKPFFPHGEPNTPDAPSSDDSTHEDLD